MPKKKETPLTVEYFHEEIIPTFELMLKNQKKEIKEEISEEIQGLKNDVISLKEEVMGEIKDFREEMTVGMHQNERNTRRLDRVEKVLDLEPLEF